MKEDVLKEYFECKMSAEVLDHDVSGSNISTGADTSGVIIESTRSNGEFDVKLDHLVKLCNDTINGSLSEKNLNIVAFTLICSDFFVWDGSTEVGDRVASVIFELDNPEIFSPITESNLKEWVSYPESGERK